MSSICLGDETGQQLQLDREHWLSQQALELLQEAADDPAIGADKTLSVLLHHGLGLPLALVAQLQQTTKNVVAKRCITGTKQLRGMATHRQRVAELDPWPSRHQTVSEWLAEEPPETETPAARQIVKSVKTNAQKSAYEQLQLFCAN